MELDTLQQRLLYTIVEERGLKSKKSEYYLLKSKQVGKTGKRDVCNIFKERALPERIIFSIFKKPYLFILYTNNANQT